MPTHYKVLGISRSAAAAEIRQAWRHWCFETHPDKVGNSPGNNALFAAIQNAYDILSDPLSCPVRCNSPSLQGTT